MNITAQVTEPPPVERPTMHMLMWRSQQRTDGWASAEVEADPPQSLGPGELHITIPGTKLAAALDEERAALEACAEMIRKKWSRNTVEAKCLAAVDAARAKVEEARKG